jgi:hypothetical protein
VADINLERKDATIWPWIVGLLALALVIWGVWAATDGTNGEVAFDDMDGVTETREWGEEQTAEVPSSVRDFLNECSVAVSPGQAGQRDAMDQPGQPGQTGQAQTGQQEPAGQQDTWGTQDQSDPAAYTENCIDMMITAMEDVADQGEQENEQISEELSRLRDRADALGEDDAESLQYSQNVQSVLTSAANLLQQIQQHRGGMQAQSEVQEMQRAAEEIQPDMPVAQQTEELSRVFQRAGTAMQMMGEE